MMFVTSNVRTLTLRVIGGYRRQERVPAIVQMVAGHSAGLWEA